MAETRAPLDTPEQVAAERLMLDLLADPAVIAIQRDLETELAQGANAQGEGGLDTLREAISRWTGALILSEQASDPARPSILWATDDAPHSWHGFTVPGRTAWGNDPNFIYRRTYFDGGGRYEISGQINPAHRPAQIAFEFMHGTPGDRQLNLQKRGEKMDFGNQIAMLTDRTMAIAPDGSFRISINADGPNPVTTGPGPVAVTIRDVLSDWTQQPPRLSIRRLDGVGGEPRSRADIRAAILAALPGHLRFWGTFPDIFYKAEDRNILKGPVARDGGWGYVASVRFALAPDQVLLVRTTPTGASYFGVQFSDRWGLTPDVQRHFSSYNNAQMVADPDGGLSFVASPTDPGTANWIDSAGERVGGMGLRWQGLREGAAPPVIREWRILTRAELDAIPDIARMTPAQRAIALVQRGQDYRRRVGQ